MRTELKSALKPLYKGIEQIYKEVRLRSPETSLRPFIAQWGVDYQPGGILFVGKATNGWIKTSDACDVWFDEDHEKCIFGRSDQMRWVEEQDYVSCSAFWRVIRGVSRNIYHCSDNWSDRIAWSNLYKLAPPTGNPSDALCEMQGMLCVRILEAEIALLRPKVVVMLTSGWEYDPFMCCLNGEADPADRLVETKVWEREKGYKAEVYRINNVIYITTKHPQGKPEAPHIESLTELIRKYR